MIEQIIGDVMTPSVQTIPPEATACDVATLFDNQDISSGIRFSTEPSKRIIEYRFNQIYQPM